MPPQAPAQACQTQYDPTPADNDNPTATHPPPAGSAPGTAPRPDQQTMMKRRARKLQLMRQTSTHPCLPGFVPAPHPRHTATYPHDLLGAVEWGCERGSPDDPGVVEVYGRNNGGL